MRRVDETFRRPGHSAAVFSGAQLRVFNRVAEPEATRALFLRFQVFKLGRAAPHAPATPSDNFREGQPPVRSTRGIISPCFPQQPLIQPTTYSPHSSAAAPSGASRPLGDESTTPRRPAVTGAPRQQPTPLSATVSHKTAPTNKPTPESAGLPTATLPSEGQQPQDTWAAGRRLRNRFRLPTPPKPPLESHI